MVLRCLNYNKFTQNAMLIIFNNHKWQPKNIQKQNPLDLNSA